MSDVQPTLVFMSTLDSSNYLFGFYSDKSICDRDNGEYVGRWYWDEKWCSIIVSIAKEYQALLPFRASTLPTATQVYINYLQEELLK
jgi:hypothetical protein